MSKLEITHSNSHLLGGGNESAEFKLFYQQGTESGLIQFSLICRNVPVGSTIGFSSDKPGPNPPIYLSPTTVSSSPSFVTGMVSEVPANYEAEITYYVIFSQTPPPDASIQLQAAYIATS